MLIPIQNFVLRVRFALAIKFFIQWKNKIFLQHFNRLTYKSYYTLFKKTSTDYVHLLNATWVSHESRIGSAQDNIKRSNSKTYLTTSNKNRNCCMSRYDETRRLLRERQPSAADDPGAVRL